MKNKIPPQSLEAEESLICTVLINSQKIDSIIDIVSFYDFYKNSNQQIFKIIEELYADNKPIDITTVVSGLKDAGKLEEVGGAAYVASIVDTIPIAVNPEAYAKIVREKSILRKLIDSSYKTFEMCFSAGADSAKVVDFAEKEILGISEDAPEDFKDVAVHVGKILDKLDEPDERRGLRTGVPKVDYQMDFVGGQMVTIAGRPSMGKSSLMRNWAQGFAEKSEARVGIFSYEMSVENMTIGFLSQLTGIPNLAIKTGMRRANSLKDKDYEKLIHAHQRISEWGMLIEPPSAPTIPSFRRKARLMKKQGVQAIFIDQLNKMTSGGVSGSITEDMTNVAMNIGFIARDLDIPIFLLAQLNRSVEANKGCRPRLSNLKQTGAIEEESEAVVFVYRAHYYTEAAEDEGLGEIIIAKNRNGEPGAIKCRWDGKKTTFTEIEQHRDYNKM